MTDDMEQLMLKLCPHYGPSPARDQWIAGFEAAVAALAAPAQQWTCFHCGEVCAGAAAARLHFGASEHQQPSCQIDLAEYRRMEEVNRRHCEEDTDLHRELHRMECKHQQAQRRAEEAGYAKGLADGRTAAPAQPDGLAEFLQFRAEFRAWRDAQSAAPAQPNTWREAVLDALASTGGDMPATATPAEIVRAVIDAHVQIALDPRVSDAAPAQQPDEPMPEYLRDMITGMSVSVDVSTGEHDAGHRYFGTVTEVMDDSHDKFGVTLLVQDAEPNFKAPSVQHGAAQAFEVRIAGPDDVVRFDDELAAHRHANSVNATYLADRLKHPDDEVLCVATVHPVATTAKPSSSRCHDQSATNALQTAPRA